MKSKQRSRKTDKKDDDFSPKSSQNPRRNSNERKSPTSPTKGDPRRRDKDSRSPQKRRLSEKSSPDKDDHNEESHRRGSTSSSRTGPARSRDRKSYSEDCRSPSYDEHDSYDEGELQRPDSSSSKRRSDPKLDKLKQKDDDESKKIISPKRLRDDKGRYIKLKVDKKGKSKSRKRKTSINDDDYLSKSDKRSRTEIDDKIQEEEDDDEVFEERLSRSPKRSLEIRNVYLTKKEVAELDDLFRRKYDSRSLSRRLFSYLFRLLLNKCHSDLTSGPGIDLRGRKIEDFLDLELSMTQKEIWSLNACLLKVKQTHNELEKKMRASVEANILAHLQNPTLTEGNDLSATCSLFIDFVVNSFVIYRRTLILLTEFEEVSTSGQSTSGQNSDSLNSILPFYNALRNSTELTIKSFDRQYVQAAILRPLFQFQNQNSKVFETLKSLKFFDYKPEVEKGDGEERKDLENFFRCLEKKNSLLQSQGILEELYERFQWKDRPEVEEEEEEDNEEEGEDSRSFKKPEVPQHESWDTAMRRHLFLVNTAKNSHPSTSGHMPKSPRVPQGDVISPAEMAIFNANRKFIWNDDSETLTWGERIAKKYYDRLFKEYCLIDLSRYQENKFGMRWRIERDLLVGKGQFVCGEVRCPLSDNLTSWEVLFTYLEQGQKKSTMVKVRLCPECSRKLNHYRQHRKSKLAEKEARRKVTSGPADKSFQFTMGKDDFLQGNLQLPPGSSVRATGEFSCPERLQQIWDLPVKTEVVEEDLEKELDDFLDSIID